MNSAGPYLSTWVMTLMTDIKMHTLINANLIQTNHICQANFRSQTWSSIVFACTQTSSMHRKINIQTQCKVVTFMSVLTVQIERWKWKKSTMSNYKVHHINICMSVDDVTARRTEWTNQQRSETWCQSWVMLDFFSHDMATHSVIALN